MRKADFIDLLKELRDQNKKDLQEKDNEQIKDFLEGRLKVYQRVIRLAKLIEVRR